MSRTTSYKNALRIWRFDSFRTRITLVVTASILMLAVSASLVTGWLLVERLHVQVRNYIVQMTGQLADNSVIAFLVDNDVTAKRTLRSVRGLPGIRYVAIIKPDMTLLLADGEPPPRWTFDKRLVATLSGPALVGEDDQLWHFAAPVITHSYFSPYEESGNEAERLGYLYVAWDKGPLTTLKSIIFVINVGISLIIAAFLIVWLYRWTNRLTRPLMDLVNVMHHVQRNDDDAGNVRARVIGPAETREIAYVFNALMDRLERHRNSLESQVAIRTLELREMRDAALTANRHKSEFMAAITHEMRTPLHAITGYTQLVLEELQFVEEPGHCQDSLTMVLQSAKDLLVRIDQILDLARTEAGKMELRLSTVDLQQIIDHIVNTVNPLLLANQNSLRVNLHGQLKLLTDQDKLSQILLNLLTNACKFTRNGSIALDIQGGEHELMIAVTDTGIGISQPQQALIFEPFRQVDMSDTRQYQGTGLGLAITKRFCELLGGTISVQSQTGFGSTFTVSLPISCPDSRDEISAPRVSHGVAAGSEKPGALSVDSAAVSTDSFG